VGESRGDWASMRTRRALESFTGPGWRFLAPVWCSLPMRTALLAVGSVWILGCVWSYRTERVRRVQGLHLPAPAAPGDRRVRGVHGGGGLGRLAGRAAGDPGPAGHRGGGRRVLGQQRRLGVPAGTSRHGHVVLGIAVPVAANLAFECCSPSCAGRCSAAGGCHRRSRCPTRG